MILKYSVGNDVGYKDFYSCIVTIDDKQQIKIKATRKFDNSPSGFKQYKQWYTKWHKDKSIPMHFCMEATGVYHEELSYFIHGEGKRVSIVLANYTNKYLESMGFKSKNDKSDAQGLAQLGAERALKKWDPPVEFYATLRCLTRHYQHLQERKTAENNRLHALRVAKHKDKFVIKHVEQSLKQLKSQIAKAAKQINKHLAKDDEARRKVSKICKIKGVGELTVAVLIAETYGFELFDSAKQLVSYSGYDVVENQSGKRQGKTKISKKGNSRIRRALHMPAFSAKKYEEVFRNLWLRTFEKHKLKMKSYVAVQRKLLTTIFALWKNDEVFESDYFKKMKLEFA
jgi:transposase